MAAGGEAAGKRRNKKTKRPEGAGAKRCLRGTFMPWVGVAAAACHIGEHTTYQNTARSSRGQNVAPPLESQGHSNKCGGARAKRAASLRACVVPAAAGRVAVLQGRGAGQSQPRVWQSMRAHVAQRGWRGQGSAGAVQTRECASAKAHTWLRGGKQPVWRAVMRCCHRLPLTAWFICAAWRCRGVVAHPQLPHVLPKRRPLRCPVLRYNCAPCAAPS